MKISTLFKNATRCRMFLAAALAFTGMTANAQSMKVFDDVTVTDQTTGNSLTYQLMSQAISPNHRYIAGQAIDYVNFYYGIFIYDTETDKALVVNDLDYMGSGLFAVNDEGIAAGYNGPAITMSIDGTVNEYKADGDYITRAYDMSDDASIVVGSYYSEMEFINHACVWIDGKFTALPEPTAEEMDLPIVETEASFINGDGSVIVGYAIDNLTPGTAIVWERQADGSYTCDPIGKDYVSIDGAEASRPYIQFKPTGVSQNGKYIALQVSKAGETSSMMALYDLDTHEFTTCKAGVNDDVPADAILESGSVANDGTMIGTMYTGHVMMQNVAAVIWKVGEESPSLIASRYDNLSQLAEFDTNYGNFITDITPDGYYLTGYSYDSNLQYKSYWIDLNTEATDINTAAKTTNAAETARYTIDGKRIYAPVKGLNIIKKADGTVVKTIVK